MIVNDQFDGCKCAVPCCAVLCRAVVLMKGVILNHFGPYECHSTVSPSLCYVDGLCVCSYIPSSRDAIMGPRRLGRPHEHRVVATIRMFNACLSTAAVNGGRWVIVGEWVIVGGCVALRYSGGGGTVVVAVQ